MSNMRLRSFVLAGAVVVSGVASVWAQSLAEVARKEEARRKAITRPAKVYTNKDLFPAPAGSTPSAASTPVEKSDDSKDSKDAGKAAGAGKDAGKDTVVKDQKYWSGRLKELQTQLDRDQTFADALQNKINSLTADFVNRDDPAQRAAIERDRQKSLDEVARLAKAIADDKKAIADLQEEARRAGVPPGWLR